MSLFHASQRRYNNISLLVFIHVWFLSLICNFVFGLWSADRVVKSFGVVFSFFVYTMINYEQFTRCLFYLILIRFIEINFCFGTFTEIK
jgi:hypothetical protein